MRDQKSGIFFVSIGMATALLGLTFACGDESSSDETQDTADLAVSGDCSSYTPSSFVEFFSGHRKSMIRCNADEKCIWHADSKTGKGKCVDLTDTSLSSALLQNARNLNGKTTDTLTKWDYLDQVCRTSIKNCKNISDCSYVKSEGRVSTCKIDCDIFSFAVPEVKELCQELLNGRLPQKNVNGCMRGAVRCVHTKRIKPKQF